MADLADARTGSRKSIPVQVSVIIVNYNCGNYLQRCLDSLSRQTVADFEAIVVDNGSQDGSLDALELPDQRFSLLPLGENLGFAAANNRGASLAQGRWLATLNPDAFPEPDWLAALLKSVERHPQAALFGSTQLLDDNPKVIDGSGDVYPIFGWAWRGNYRHPLRELPQEGQVFSPCAAAALYRADLFRELGGFDESLFCYCEDVDLGFRFRLQGHYCIQVPTAVVRHVSSGLQGKDSPLAHYLGHRNSIWVHIKNMPWPLPVLSLPLHVLFELSWIIQAVIRHQFGAIKNRQVLRLQLHARVLALRHGLLHCRQAGRQRKKVQRRRKASAMQIARSLCWSVPRFFRRKHDVRV